MFNFAMQCYRVVLIMWLPSTLFFIETSCNEIQRLSNVSLDTQPHSKRGTMGREPTKKDLPRYYEENPKRRAKISMTSQGLYINYATDEPSMPSIAHHMDPYAYDDGDDVDKDHNDNIGDDNDNIGEDNDDDDDDGEEDEHDDIPDDRNKMRQLEKHKLTQLLLLKELQRLKEENARKVDLMHKLRHSYGESSGRYLTQFPKSLLTNEFSNEDLDATQKDNTNSMDKPMTKNEDDEEELDYEVSQNPLAPTTYQHTEEAAASENWNDIKTHDVEFGDQMPASFTDPSFNDDVSDYEKDLRAEMKEKIQKDTLAESKINQTTETMEQTIHNKTEGIETNSTVEAFKNIDTLDKNKTFTSSKESKKRLTFLLDQLGNHVPTDKQRKKITMLKKKINQTSDNKIIQHLTNTSSNLLKKLKSKSFTTKANFININTTASLKRTTVKAFRFHSNTTRTVSGIAKNKISTRLPRYKFIRPQRQFLFFSPVAVKYETNRKRENLTSFLKHHERIKNRRKELTKSHHPRKKVDLSKHKDFIKKNYWNYLQFKQHIDAQPRKGFAEKKSVLV